ncbi:leukocyte elastase inhibitor-like [Archocentrus centrarchus]|uniref:leukocyte elastase inhibitor-like n=1 Tax=Archocentrus centrarchus TaxID=63155 RepID=UPI0011E9F445|nr:leukocyte elastase inhibitor-like [Archocentrus centrarchus]
MASSVPLSKACTTFCLAMQNKLSEEDNTANIFFSPISISSALAMVMLGAQGNTATQMSEVLGFSEVGEPKPKETQQEMQSSMVTPIQTPMQTRTQMQTQTQQQTRLPSYLRKCLKPEAGEDDVHAAFAKLLTELNKADAPYSLSLANRLYGEQSYEFVKEFLNNTKKYYKAELESVDFKGNPEKARVHINSWVEKQTKEKIKNLLDQDAVNGLTKMVLVSAIYFKGKWNKQFEKERTVDVQFRLNKKVTKPVKMMHQTSKFAFASIPEASCKILEMPYKGNDLSMLIFLPDDIEDDTTGLQKLQKLLTYQNFVDWTHPDKMRQTEVEVQLPRFKMEEKYDLKKLLTSMGMEDAFDSSKSNFSGMSPANDLFVSKVVHKAFVDVNEEGTEAAAATGIAIGVTSITIPVEFIADHPFLFFIRHNTTKNILFVGRFCSPK